MCYTLDYFDKRTTKQDNGCIVWNGSVRSNGYSRLASSTAHSIIYRLVKGPVPTGLQIDHTCRNKLCVNPEHLEAVTAKENQRRRTSIITHCKNGHPLSGENLYVTPDNRRQCKCCRRGAVYASYLRS